MMYNDRSPRTRADSRKSRLRSDSAWARSWFAPYDQPVVPRRAEARHEIQRGRVLHRGEQLRSDRDDAEDQEDDQADHRLGAAPDGGPQPATGTAPGWDGRLVGRGRCLYQQASHGAYP